MLTVHHLGKSQSERIVWLCEELGIPYELKRYARDPVTILAPPEYRALHPIGAAPVITDNDLVLAESGAIVAYIIARHGGGRLAPGPSHPDFASYLYWFHFANGTLQPVLGRISVLRRAGTPEDHPAALFVKERLGRALGHVEARLGEADYFAGREFTAADIMAVFSLTTMRHFAPVDLTPYPNIRAYLQRIGAREPYRRAMAKGDPDMPPLLT
jgi:glutathione S-transferase